MINYILDTLWEFWQYLKPNRTVYLAGLKYEDRYILIKMVPEGIDKGDGWEKLTDPMPIKKAEQRVQHFKLIRLVAPKNSPQIGT